jgi:elongation factor G
VDKNGELITYEFQNDCIGTNIPPEFIPSCGKGFADACERGAMIGAQVQGMRVVLTDGQAHAVDSSDLAFRLAAAGAVRTAMRVSVLCVL